MHLADRFQVYERVTQAVFRSPNEFEEIIKFFPDRPVEYPMLGWHEAQAAGEKLMAEEAKAQGFKVVRPVSLNYFNNSGLYNYIVETDRTFPTDNRMTVFFDANTGAFHERMQTRKEYLGNTVTNWLFALHMIQDPVDYLPYRILVAITGFVIVMLSTTGVYIWWRKRQARTKAAAHRPPSPGRRLSVDAFRQGTLGRRSG